MTLSDPGVQSLLSRIGGLATGGSSTDNGISIKGSASTTKDSDDKVDVPKGNGDMDDGWEDEPTESGQQAESGGVDMLKTASSGSGSGPAEKTAPGEGALRFRPKRVGISADRRLRTVMTASKLLQSTYEVKVTLRDQQADPNSPLYSAKSFEELGLCV